MKTEIWLVEVHCGEYSDRCDWVVCAYRNKADADKHAHMAELEAAALNAKYPRSWDIPAKANPYDAAMQTDYTGTNYTVGLTELHD
jgi:hypothetical protein